MMAILTEMIVLYKLVQDFSNQSQKYEKSYL